MRGDSPLFAPYQLQPLPIWRHPNKLICICLGFASTLLGILLIYKNVKLKERKGIGIYTAKSDGITVNNRIGLGFAGLILLFVGIILILIPVLIPTYGIIPVEVIVAP